MSLFVDARSPRKPKKGGKPHFKYQRDYKTALLQRLKALLPQNFEVNLLLSPVFENRARAVKEEDGVVLLSKGFHESLLFETARPVENNTSLLWNTPDVARTHTTNALMAIVRCVAQLLP